jgi:hypothetical protein
VIGGSGSFVVPVCSWDEFPNNVGHMLVIELSRLVPKAPQILQAELMTELKADYPIGEKVRADFDNHCPG